MDLIDKAKNFVSEKIANMEKPEATITDVDLKGIGFDGLAFHAKVSVKNPYSVPIPIMEIDYVLKSATRVIASGRIPDPGSMKANDSTMLDVPVKVPHSVLVSLVRDIGGDWDVDYTWSWVLSLIFRSLATSPFPSLIAASISFLHCQIYGRVEKKKRKKKMKRRKKIHQRLLRYEELYLSNNVALCA